MEGGDDRIITNIVSMGMGEPLATSATCVPAIQIFLDDLGFDISRRRVTLSTSGLVPQIYKLAEESELRAGGVAARAERRACAASWSDQSQHNIAELLEACWHYLDEQNGRSVTFEYVMLDGVNDQPEHARRARTLLRDKPAKVNLIPFNPFPGTTYRRSPRERDRKFATTHAARGHRHVRKTRGDDIDAACGQLAGQVTDRHHRAAGLQNLRFAGARMNRQWLVGLNRRLCLVGCVAETMAESLSSMTIRTSRPPKYNVQRGTCTTSSRTITQLARENSSALSNRIPKDPDVHTTLGLLYDRSGERSSPTSTIARRCGWRPTSRIFPTTTRSICARTGASDEGVERFYRRSPANKYYRTPEVALHQCRVCLRGGQAPRRCAAEIHAALRRGLTTAKRPCSS
jgi:hypothetical protein